MLTWFIRAIHATVVAFFLLAPFSDNQQILTLHLLLVPFLLLHWITNQSVCALTELEKMLCGKEDDCETFMGKIMGPIYTFQTPENEDAFVWCVLIGLWFITLYKVKQDDFSHIRDVLTRLRETLRR
jgi:hypothetical protein